MATSVTVRINGQERAGVDEGWIGQTIAAFKRAGEPVCVQMHIHHPTAQLGLSMGSCPSGPGRPPRDAEPELIRAWNECIGTGPVEPGRAISCIKRLEHMVT
jgi:hypothetical protein